MSPLVVWIVETLGELLKDAIAAAVADNPAEAERQVLIKAQRKISDELARRSLT